jgi:hypothetical protein
MHCLGSDSRGPSDVGQSCSGPTAGGEGLDRSLQYPASCFCRLLHADGRHVRPLDIAHELSVVLVKSLASPSSESPIMTTIVELITLAARFDWQLVGPPLLPTGSPAGASA